MDLNRIGGTAGFWNNHEVLHEGYRAVGDICPKSGAHGHSASVIAFIV
jgi:hypothetical protein